MRNITNFRVSHKKIDVFFSEYCLILQVIFISTNFKIFKLCYFMFIIRNCLNTFHYKRYKIHIYYLPMIYTNYSYKIDKRLSNIHVVIKFLLVSY